MKKSKGGRPPKFTDKQLLQAQRASQAGFTDEEIADLLGIVTSTYYEWLKKYPELTEAIKRGKEEPDSLVEASLFKRATGFRRRVEKLDKDGCVHEIWEELPPDPVSMIFWLKNRRRDKWRDKQEVEHSGNVTVVIED